MAMTGAEDADAGRTTLMVRNLAGSCTRTALLRALDSDGLAGWYDFVYVPTKFRSYDCCGYAFVNFVSSEAAQHALATLQGFCRPTLPCAKPLEVCWSASLQGLEAHVERYRNSAAMCPGVPDECKPLLLVNGAPAAFPAPTRNLKAPRGLR